MLENCMLCPHKCGVNRIEGKKGRCKCDDKLKIALASLHMYEEPCISGTNGSGTIFFSFCNLRCLFCQNYKISALNYGKEISIYEFSKMNMLSIRNLRLLMLQTRHLICGLHFFVLF